MCLQSKPEDEAPKAGVDEAPKEGDHEPQNTAEEYHGIQIRHVIKLN